MTHLHFSSSDIKKLERFYRVNLINSATGYKSANLIGTYAKEGTANLALFSSVMHLGSNPALIGFIQRPIGPNSHTYKNIIQTGYYTINSVHEDFVEKAHYTSAKFAQQASEFDRCKLTEEQISQFKAPFVKESKIKIGMKFIQKIEIALNNTILIIGEPQHLYVEKDAVLDDGNIDLSGLRSICTSGQASYHKGLMTKTLPHAKVDEVPGF